MPTTSNFGWTTPADTDLVKDGAAAIRTLGNGIDTSLVDLKGGTTGQVLSKNSNTDLDYTWVTPNVGDITEVQAGTGISVASGTGPIPVVTNDMATTITAAGDIVVGTGSGTYDNLPIGTTGQVLTADTTVSPYKVKWAAAAGSSGPTFKAYRTTSNQTINQNTYTKIQFNEEVFDTDSCYDKTTNYRFTPNKAGYYQMNISIVFENGTNGTSSYVYFYKNGAADLDADWSGSVGPILQGSYVVYMNGTTDYIEGYVYANASSGTRAVYAGITYSQFSGHWIRD